MRILFLGEPESPNTMCWVDGLREQGCEVFLASARTNGSDGNIPIGSPKFSPRLRMLTGIIGLKRKIKEITPDILIAYRVTSYGYIAARTGFHPLVIAAQNDKIVFEVKPTFFRRKLLEYYAKYAIKKADLIHAWSRNLAQGLLKFNADKNKLWMMHRGLNMKLLKQNTNKRVFDPEAPVFISTRSLASEYLIDKLIDSFRLVVNKIPDAKLEIIGSGPEEATLKKQTEKLELNNNVCFHGRLKESEVFKSLSMADFYISLIQTDGISSSLIEAVASTLMPIVADMPASRELLTDRINSFMFSHVEVKKIAEIMLKSVSSFEEMLPALKENSRIIIDHYDRDKNQKIFIDKYKDLLNVTK